MAGNNLIGWVARTMYNEFLHWTRLACACPADLHKYSTDSYDIGCTQ